MDKEFLFGGCPVYVVVCIEIAGFRHFFAKKLLGNCNITGIWVIVDTKPHLVPGICHTHHIITASLSYTYSNTLSINIQKY